MRGINHWKQYVCYTVIVIGTYVMLTRIEGEHLHQELSDSSRLGVPTMTLGTSVLSGTNISSGYGSFLLA